MLKGSCLCQSIEFNVIAMEGMVFNCHCNRCKKAHGAAFSTQVLAQKESLQFTKGKEFLSEFEVPSAIRAFCSQCGSRLMNYSRHEDYLSIALTALDTPMHTAPIGECFVGQKLEFTSLNPKIPHFKALPS